MNKTVLLGCIYCLIACMAWGAMFPVAHEALKMIDPFYFSFIRYGIVTVILAVLLYLKEGKKAFRFEGKGLLLTGLGIMAFVVYNFLVFLGQAQLGEKGTIVASMMEVLMPSITIIIVWLASRKAPAKQTILNVIIAFFGATLVITRGDLSFFSMNSNELLPLLYIFIGVIGWVVYSLGGKAFPGWSMLRYSTLTCILGTVISGLIVSGATVSGALELPSVSTLLTLKWHMAFMSLIPGLVALLAWNKGLQLLSSTSGILFINMVPITTFIIIALQGYHISFFEILGTLIIIVSLIHNTLAEHESGSHYLYKIKRSIRARRLKMIRYAFGRNKH